MTDITGGELLVRCLANEGVEFVFGLPCPEVDPVLAALDARGLRFVPVRHEAAAVHMAEGLYKTSGRLAAVLGNPGPGSANLLPGVITARHEGVPVFVVTAQHRLGIVYPSPPSTFQGQDQLDLFKPAVKWSAPLFSWDRIPEVVRMAAREMWTGRPGPVHLEAPMPVIYATGDPSSAPVRPPQRHRASPPQPSQAQLEQAAEMLAGAERPLVVAGAGVDRAGANAPLLEIVERLDCPVSSTMAGRSSVPFDHPNHVYGFAPPADAVRREADVVLVAGSRLGNLDLPFDKYWGDPEKARLIQIDVDPRHVGVTRPIELGIVSDLAPALEALAEALRRRGAGASGGWNLDTHRRALRALWDAELDRIAGWGGPGVHPGAAMQGVGRVFGGESIYVTDGGMTSLWAHWLLPATRPRSYHNILELGMLGTGIPSALGSRLAAPDRDVVCVTGDGAAGFNFMEMQSAAREGLAFTTVVFAEGSWTMEVPNERLLFGQTFGTEMGEVRWDEVARGPGRRGHFVEKLDELQPALRAAREADAPSVVCVRTDREANLAVPPELFARFFEVYQGPQG
jgi:acetolactate synthase-1/2/3 large subunit